jgi:hypothetical protein
MRVRVLIVSQYFGPEGFRVNDVAYHSRPESLSRASAESRKSLCSYFR